MHAAAIQWAVFGAGAVCGPLFAGVMAQRMGWNAGLSLSFIVKAFAVFIPVVWMTPIGITLSSFIVGAMVPGIVALTSGRIAELAGYNEHKRYWGIATEVFAIAQAASDYGMSAFYEIRGSYHSLFFISSILLLGGAALIVVSGFVHQRKEQSFH